MSDVELNENDPCPDKECDGKLVLEEREGSCCCHVAPPCSYCVEGRHYLECDSCGEDYGMQY